MGTLQKKSKYIHTINYYRQFVTMIQVLKFSLCILLLWQCTLSESAATEKDKEESAKAIAQQTLDLEKCFRGEDSQFFSAMSLSTAMAMLLAGAKGNTFTQITKGLHFENFSVRDANKFYAEIYSKGSSNYTLDLANRLFVQTGFDILQTYLAELRDYYLAPLQLVDYAQNPIQAAKTINNFINNATRGMIPNIFPDNAFVGTSTVLVLANAIYFKGFWVFKFNKALTTEDEFTLSNGQKTTAKYMTQEGRLKYTDNAKLYSALQLDYEGGDISMTIILPNKKDGITTLLNTITANELVQLSTSTSYTRTYVNVKLPKFKYEKTYSTNLVKCLNALGILDVFDESKSNLTGIAITGPSLTVGEIIQKAVIEVDEEGSKAAAATVIKVCRGLCPVSVQDPPLPINFHAIHPFFFFISDSRTKAILFSGTFMKP